MIGQEGQERFAVWDETRGQLIHIPEEAEFLRVHLKPTDQAWQTLALHGWAKTKREAFIYDGKEWSYASPDTIVFGWIIGRELDVVTLPLRSLDKSRDKSE